MRRRSPRACASSAGFSTACLRPRIRRKACARSSKSAPPSSRIAERRLGAMAPSENPCRLAGPNETQERFAGGGPIARRKKGVLRTLSPESRLPLSRERRSALAKVLPQRRRLDKIAQLGRVAPNNRFHRPLGPADRGLTEPRDLPRPALDGGGHLARRNPPIDQPDGEGLLGLDPPAAEQEVLGAGRSDEFDQSSRFDGPVEQAELGGRDCEVRVLG